MAVIRINAARDGTLTATGPEPDWRKALTRAIARTPPQAPVTVLAHGFRYTHRPGARNDPHRQLYIADAILHCRRRRPSRAAWAHGLGFSDSDPEDGLCIAFGWDASRPRLGEVLRHRRNGLALVYAIAAAAGRALAEVLRQAALARPGLRVGALAHSLGARVILTAAAEPATPPLDQAVLLGAAEFSAEARRLLARAPGPTRFLHVLSRANDPYDGLFRLLAPAPGGPDALTLGTRGLGIADPNWLDLQLDHPQLAPWLAQRGIRLERGAEAFSHWHFYADAGAMALWRLVLRRAPGWSLAELVRDGLPRAIEPRWSRLGARVPDWKQPRWPGRPPSAEQPAH